MSTATAEQPRTAAHRASVGSPRRGPSSRVGQAVVPALDHHPARRRRVPGSACPPEPLQSRTGRHTTPVRRPPRPHVASLAGIFAQLAIGVLGVLVIAGEYSTGMIRATLAAVPSRLPVLWAKAAVFAAVTLVPTVPSVLAAFLIGQSILGAKHLQTWFGHPGVRAPSSGRRFT